LLTGTFDGVIEIDGQQLQSPFGIRSGVLLYYSFEQGLKGLYQAESTVAVSALECIWIDTATAYFVLNFVGNLDFLNVNENAGVFFKSLGGLIQLSSTGIHSNGTDEAIVVFPNPTRDYLYVSDGYTFYSLFDLNGRLVKNGSEQPIKVSALQPGMYIALFYFRNGSNQMYRVFIQ